MRALENITPDRLALLTWLLVAAVLSPRTAHAVQRVAIVVGNNIGGEGDELGVVDEALDRISSIAARSGHALVEAHGHAFGPPAFSLTDRKGLDRLIDQGSQVGGRHSFLFLQRQQLILQFVSLQFGTECRLNDRTQWAAELRGPLLCFDEQVVR